MYPPVLHISNRFQALNDEDELNICPVEKHWTGGKITVDSGAAESVWPEGLMPEIQTKPSVGSQTGVTYVAANGNRMPNLGEKKVHFKTKDGLNFSITFQVTKVKKPLAAVSKITQKGNWIRFGPSEAYIENPHHKSGHEERDVPELHMDYCFMGKVDEKAQPFLS